MDVRAALFLPTVVSVPISSDLFEAYLKCATKCFLRSRGEIGTGNTYANHLGQILQTSR